LSAGNNDGGGKWTLTQSDLMNLTISPDSNVVNDFDISIKAVTKDGSASALETVSKTINVNVNVNETLDYSLSADAAIIKGFAGNDILTGGDGNDDLFGGAGDDTLTGGAGSDSFIWTATDSGTDSVTDFQTTDGDVLDLSDLLSNPSNSIEGIEHGGHLQLKIGVANAVTGEVATPIQTIDVNSIEVGDNAAAQAMLTSLLTSNNIVD